MAELFSEFEVKRNEDLYKGRIKIGGFNVRYKLGQNEDNENEYNVNFTGKEFYKILSKKDFTVISRSFLEGIIMCINDFQRNEPLKELGINFMDKNGKTVSNDWDTGEYDILLRIPKRLKKTIRKAYLKKVNYKKS